MFGEKHRLRKVGAIRVVITIFATLVVWFIPHETHGQREPLNVPGGTRVVLKIPAKIIGFEKVGLWSGSLKYGTVIEQTTTSGLVVGGLAQWRTSGWPLMRQLTLEKVSRNNRFTEIELSDPLFKVRLRFDTTVKDLNAAFRAVAFIGLLSEFEVSDYYQQEVIAKVLPLIFSGKLSSIPTKAELQLLKEVNYIDSAIKTERYKGGTYLVLNAGGDVQIYNTIQMDQSQRVAHALNQRVLSYIKRIAKIIKFHPEVDGIKVEIALPYKNFVSEYYNEPNYDNLEFYAPMDVIRQFAEDELTNQEFAEESILLVNRNRSRIPTLESR